METYGDGDADGDAYASANDNRHTETRALTAEADTPQNAPKAPKTPDTPSTRNGSSNKSEVIRACALLPTQDMELLLNATAEDGVNVWDTVRK
jgi:hypothetical protein